MSIVSTQPPQAPKGFHPNKMGRLILWSFFFGLFAFSMLILLEARFEPLHDHYHHSDPLVSKLAEEVKALKEAQSKNYRWMNNIHDSQRQIFDQQAELSTFKQQLIQEVNRVERMVVDTQRSYNNVQSQLRQHEDYLNSLAKDVQNKPNYNNNHYQGNQQDKNIIALNNAYKELANKLESFRSTLSGYDVKIRDNTRMISQNIQELKNYVSGSKNEMDILARSYHNNQKDLVNEVRDHKRAIEQVSQNNIRQSNEVKEVSRSLNSLRDYTLEVVQKLSSQRFNGAMNGRATADVNLKADSEVSQLATEFKNFKEYTMDTFRELRAQQNTNTKRINHIETRESDREEEAPVSELVSQEVDKLFSDFSEGNLLEKVLQQASVSPREVQVFVDIVKRLAEGDINGVMSILNRLSDGNLLSNLMSSENGLFNELKPLVELMKDVSEGNWSNIMKHVSWFNKLTNDKAEGRSSNQATRLNNQRKNVRKEKKEDKEDWLEDLLEWF